MYKITLKLNAKKIFIKNVKICFKKKKREEEVEE